MPAKYAHYRFGKQILSAIPAKERQCIQRFRRLFDMGLQGPDIFFYYNPLMKTAVGDLYAAIHGQTGQEFFTRACPQANTEAARAYLYGLLGHYCLDSVCLPFVRKKESSGEARRGELETEFDRYLLEIDGLTPPHNYDLSPHIKLTRGECVTVAAFYPPATPANVNASVRHMAWAARLLAGTNRKRTEKIVNIPKNQAISDLLMPTEGHERWTRTDSEMLVLYTRALKRYSELLPQLTAYMLSEEPLGEDFGASFE